MRGNDHRRTAAAIALLAACAFTASAHGAGSTWYLGAGIGQAQYQFSEERDLGRVSPVVDEHSHDLGYDVLAGYSFNQYLAVEGGYEDFGRARRIVGWPVGVAGICIPSVISACNGNRRETVDASALDIVGVGNVPVTERLGAFVVFGISRLKAERTVSQFISERFDETATHALYGAGINYRLTEALGLRLKWIRSSGGRSVLDGMRMYSVELLVLL